MINRSGDSIRSAWYAVGPDVFTRTVTVSASALTVTSLSRGCAVV
jgi:hypothetical protein